MQYNPQVELQFSLINDDGSESDMTVNLLGGPAGDYSDLRHSPEWEPLQVNISFDKSLGGTQDQAQITIHNSPYIESIYIDYQAELEKIRDQKWRVRVFAWHDDSPVPRARPNIPPAFVGDITEDFNVVNDDINDASIQLQCLGHGWLARSGKYKNTWQSGTTYRRIVIDLFAEMIRRGYGRELRGSAPKSVVSTDARLNKALKRGFSVNRNPCETLNDICRDLDFVWGIHNNIPYILPRDGVLKPTNNHPTSAPIPAGSLNNSFLTGMTSLVNFGKFSYSTTSLYDAYFMPGREIFVGTLTGRINEVSGELSNYGDGHQCKLDCQYVKNNVAILPPKRADNSGLRNE